jgi:hypothetical protein
MFLSTPGLTKTVTLTIGDNVSAEQVSVENLSTDAENIGGKVKRESSGVVNGYVYGGGENIRNATNNVEIVNGSRISSQGFIYGGFVNNRSNASGNSVTVKSVKLGCRSVYSRSTKSGEAKDNYVQIIDGISSGNVNGGFICLGSTNASTNKVSISGGPQKSAGREAIPGNFINNIITFSEHPIFIGNSTIYSADIYANGIIDFLSAKTLNKFNRVTRDNVVNFEIDKFGYSENANIFSLDLTHCGGCWAPLDKQDTLVDHVSFDSEFNGTGKNEKTEFGRLSMTTTNNSLVAQC